jgi:hypothetical protein
MWIVFFLPLAVNGEGDTGGEVVFNFLSVFLRFVPIP